MTSRFYADILNVNEVIKMSDARFQLVVKHNDLIQKSRFNLSLQEQRVILFLISKIKPTDDNLKEYEFNILDFCEVAGIKEPRGSYDSIKKVLLSLYRKGFELENEKKWVAINWIIKPQIDKSSGVIKLKLDEDLMPFLLDLKNNFTAYELYSILNFKSKYSVQIYEILKSNEFKKQFETSVEDLQFKLNSKYDRFYDFKKRVIEPAVKEINEQTELNINVSYIKNGRTYEYIKFIIKNKFKS